MLLETQGVSAPRCVRDFAVSCPVETSVRVLSLTIIQLDVKYAFIAFNFSHFPESSQTELVRVANKMTQKLGLKYFWVSISCTGFSDEENATPEKKKEIYENDVR
jgi:hypothetical protein